MLFSLVLLASVGLLGWWAWRHFTGRGIVRDSAPAWSHDSQRLIFAAEDHGQSDIYLTTLVGSSRVNLTNRPSNESSPAFSPDGQKIAFESDFDGNFEIYVMRADGNAPQRLTNNPARDMAPAWSPDGNQIVFMSSRGGAEYDIYRMSAVDGSNVEALTTGGSYWSPQVSPDGVNIAVHKVRDLFVLNLRSRSMRQLTYEPMNGMHPSWSPDGRQLAFMSWRNGRTEIFTAKADGSEQQLLVTMPTGDAVDPSWSPNGEFIAFVHVTGRDEREQKVIYAVDVKTGRLTRISR